MSRTTVWILAVLITLVSAVWQRRSGPTRPVRGRAVVAGAEATFRFERSHGGDGDQPVRVKVADPGVAGTLLWRRYPTSEPFRQVEMRRDGDELVAFLPHQPPAGKLQYTVRLARGTAFASLPDKLVVTRFKGAVPTAILLPHVLAMVATMLLSAAAALTALAGRGVRRLTLVTLFVLAVGGFVLGPIVQKLAFGAWWTGVPFGWDLTDNKTLVAGLAWAVAAWRGRQGRDARWAVVAAGALTLLVFAIPHSAFGSEIRWETPGAPPAP